MVLITSLVTPPLLRAAFKSGENIKPPPLVQKSDSDLIKENL
jgi:hypothetical protein